MSENYPTSANAATEQHADTKPDEDDLTTTKALTRGTEDVDNGNVGRQDPHTKAEASAQGTSAKCSETTTVVLKSTPHEMQTELQNSLQTTPRLPIEDEPSECTQEAADSDVMAGRTNEMDTDVDRMALLGGEPAERVHIVDEDDETEREPQTRLQQTGFYCEESHQRSGNAMDNIPVTHGVPLEGEWTRCASGEVSDPKLDGIESEGCASGMDEWVCIDEADSNAGRGIEPADSPNELTEFIALSIELEDLGSGDTPRVYLGSTRVQMGDANGPGHGTDASRGQTDRSNGRTDTLSVSNHAETACVSHGEGAETYLGAGGMKRPVHETDGIEGHADASSGHPDVSSIETDARISANEPESVRLPQKKVKPPDLPSRSARTPPDEPNGVGDHTDASNARTDVQGDGNEAEMSEKDSVNVRMRQTR